MSAFEPVIVQSGEERVTVWEFDEGRNHIRCLLSAADTAGRLAIFENRIGPGGTIPTHYHENEDEYWYVLDNGLEVQLGDKTTRVGENSVIAIPAGTKHAFVNIGGAVVRALFFTTSGGLEAFFDGLSRLTASPDSTPEDIARLLGATGITYINED